MSSTVPVVVKRGSTITLDPHEKRPMAIDWTRRLHGLGETTPELAAVSADADQWTVTPIDDAASGGVSVDSIAIETDEQATAAGVSAGGGKRIRFRLVGALVGVGGKYAVTHHATSDGTPVMEDDCTFYVRVVQH